ncbi:peptide chain release factor 1 [Strigomonas culicis]|nr:peptide chain release factor 1 [Strigomonas culicis]|eukprot:EPY29296.1 peptide chain release factor 1 [Strigomonas culicis]
MALHTNSRWLVRQHDAVGAALHALAPGSGAANKVNFAVALVHIYRDWVEHGHHGEHCRGGLHLTGCVRHGHSLHFVNANFVVEVTVHIVPRQLELEGARHGPFTCATGLLVRIFAAAHAHLTELLRIGLEHLCELACKESGLLATGLASNSARPRLTGGAHDILRAQPPFHKYTHLVIQETYLLENHVHVFPCHLEKLLIGVGESTVLFPLLHLCLQRQRVIQLLQDGGELPRHVQLIAVVGVPTHHVKRATIHFVRQSLLWNSLLPLLNAKILLMKPKEILYHEGVMDGVEKKACGGLKDPVAIINFVHHYFFHATSGLAGTKAQQRGARKQRSHRLKDVVVNQICCYIWYRPKKS